MNSDNNEISNSIIDDHPVLYCVAFFLLGILGTVLEAIAVYRAVQFSDVALSVASQFHAAELMMHSANLGLVIIGFGVGIQIYMKHVVIRKQH